MSVSSLSRDWLSVEYLRLLFQNLVVEERSDIRKATLDAWRVVLDILSETTGWLESLITQQLLLDWYAILMTPLGSPLEKTTFYDPTVTSAGADATERHNVDKNMLAQDLTLVSTEVVIQARIAAATAMAYVTARWPDAVSGSAHRSSSLTDIRMFRVHVTMQCSAPF